jgi:hypothetical protein
MDLETRKLIRRIIISPLMLVINLFWAIILSCEMTFDFVRYGGEMITYDKDSKKMIQDVYELVLTKIQNK